MAPVLVGRDGLLAGERIPNVDTRVTFGQRGEHGRHRRPERLPVPRGDRLRLGSGVILLPDSSTTSEVFVMFKAHRVSTTLVLNTPTACVAKALDSLT